jgi:competence protein ComFC
MKLFTFFENLLDLVYPKLCLVCNQYLVEAADGVCVHCISKLPRTSFHQYPDNPVTQIFTGRLNLKKATAYLYFEKSGITQRMLHLLKYQKETGVGKLLGEIAGRDLSESDFLHDIDYIIPIPLHPKKLALRGYNQSEVVGSAMAKASGRKLLTKAIVRNTNTSSQTRKGRFERWINVEDIFVVKDTHLLSGKHVLLLDDVVTTGSTIESCAQTLLQVPDVEVSVFCMAFAP